MALDNQISYLATAVGTTLKGKQDKLVSGTSIKTVNGISLLGSGNIPISGGGTQNVYIQETEPTADVGTKLLWIQTNANGSIMFNLVEGV